MPLPLSGTELAGNGFLFHPLEKNFSGSAAETGNGAAAACKKIPGAVATGFLNNQKEKQT
ncbi:hypothetical protein [Akkermansia sp.]|uniref:hypothetical protein n=1 Tax=Akkermansia sp. TaxID=1872421 RepID=UPI003A370D72